MSNYKRVIKNLEKNDVFKEKTELSVDKVELAKIDPASYKNSLNKVDSKLGQLEGEMQKAFNVLKSGVKQMRNLLPDRDKIFEDVEQALDKATELRRDLAENGIPTGQLDKIMSDLDNIYNEANDAYFEDFVDQMENRIY